MAHRPKRCRALTRGATCSDLPFGAQRGEAEAARQGWGPGREERRGEGAFLGTCLSQEGPRERPLTTGPHGGPLRRPPRKGERGPRTQGRAPGKEGDCGAWPRGAQPVHGSLHAAVPRVTNVSLLHAAASPAISLFTRCLDRFGGQSAASGVVPSLGPGLPLQSRGRTSALSREFLT